MELRGGPRGRQVDSYSRGLRSWKIVNREYQNSCFKPKIGQI